MDGIAATDVTNISDASVTAKINGAVSAGIIGLTTPGGYTTFPRSDIASKDVFTQANGDLTIPGLGSGNGIYIVPTPSFAYNSIPNGSNNGYRGQIWGNNFATETDKLSIGNKMLLPQTSSFGLKMEWTKRLTNKEDTAFVVGLVIETNLLVKKVAYLDDATKTVTLFNPFVIHPKLGFTGSFFNNSCFASTYLNVLTVQSANDQFASFFNSGGKNAFGFFEVNVGGYFDVGNEKKQNLKLEFNLLINNKDCKYMYNSNNSIIPNIKLAFVSTL